MAHTISITAPLNPPTANLANPFTVDVAIVWGAATNKPYQLKYTVSNGSSFTWTFDVDEGDTPVSRALAPPVAMIDAEIVVELYEIQPVGTPPVLQSTSNSGDFDIAAPSVSPPGPV
jgi:hypothetical protein